MEEIHFEFESIDPEEFDLEAFQDKVQQELSEMIPPVLVGELSQVEQVVATIKREYILPFPPKEASLLYQVMRSWLFVTIGITIGLLLARMTSISLPILIIYNICFFLFLFSVKFVLAYREMRISKARQAFRETQANKARLAFRETMRAEDAAKQRISQLSQLKAGEIVEKPNIKKLLCPVLRSVTTDAFEISKTITPVLTGAVIIGTISIPLNPILFAAIAVVIAKSGVNGFCADYK
jgi:Ca2+/Na+ antiporter